jgi:hypothetical protein
MRLWSIHPYYLDSKGLVAVWREGLLAQACLGGKTKGYTNHPQLNRFKESKDPLGLISAYLLCIASEATKRKYQFNTTKILEAPSFYILPVTDSQIKFEWIHFLKKIKVRDPFLYQKLFKIDIPSPHPIFKLTNGDIEPWEKI